MRSPFSRGNSPFGSQSAPAVVLSNFVDNLEQDPPIVSFDSSGDGTLTWDLHSSSTPPAIGMGNIGTGMQVIVGGSNSIVLDLEAYAGETGYLHFRVGNSNVLTTQQITLPPTPPAKAIQLRAETYLFDRPGNYIETRV